MIPNKKLLNLLGNLPKNLESMQEHLRSQSFEGSASGDWVKIIIDGEGCMQSIKINPDCVDKEDLALLEELIKKAFLSAHQKHKQWLKSQSMNLLG